MRTARVFDLFKVSPPASSNQRCQDEGTGSRTETIAAATSEPILVGTLDKPIQAAATTDHHHPAPQQQQLPQQQHVWTQGLEKLLEDPLGLRAFADFAKKEFSQENIYFLVACKRFHRLFPTEDTTTVSYEAQKIFERYLGPNASDPINVDYQAVEKAKDNLCQLGPELFNEAHKQVFEIMNDDSYPRFLRSPIYRECVQALQHNEAPPISELTLNDPDLKIDYDFGKKSESDAGEWWRRALLPCWPKKNHSNSKMEQSRTISKKSMAPTKSEGTIQNPNLSVGNTKSNPATAHLMPPPTVPLGSRKPNSQRNPVTRLENEAMYERLPLYRRASESIGCRPRRVYQESCV